MNCYELYFYYTGVVCSLLMGIGLICCILWTGFHLIDCFKNKKGDDEWQT